MWSAAARAEVWQVALGRQHWVVTEVSQLLARAPVLAARVWMPYTQAVVPLPPRSAAAAAATAFALVLLLLVQARLLLTWRGLM